MIKYLGAFRQHNKKSIFIILSTIIASIEFLVPISTAHAASSRWHFSSPSDYIFDSLKIEIADSQARLRATDDWYAPDWSYRVPITIDNSDNAETLVDYQVLVNLNPDTFDFSKANSDGSDILFTASDGATPLRFWLEDYNPEGQTLRAWPRVPTVPAFSTTTIFMYYGNPALHPSYFRVSVDPTTHENFGLAYPVTYVFSVPEGSSSLRAYKRYAEGQDWEQLTEKTSNDFFNGIEAVRFDYANNRAYVSAAFSATSDELHLKITDEAGEMVSFTYQGTTEYYDNRDAVVTATADDWDGYSANNTGFKTAADAFASRQMWFTAGVITDGYRRHSWPPPVWSDIQSKVDAGYVEIASHSRNHLDKQYSYTGSHTGSDNEPFALTDSAANFPVNEGGFVYDLVGLEITNVTDDSTCMITANTQATITCSAGLSGGTNNVWNNGDVYVISQYDAELGGSRDDILDNLTNLPYSKGDKGYVLAWLRPNGISEATLQQELGEHKYLTDRSTDPDRDGFERAIFANRHYSTGGSLWLDSSNLTAANAKFDAVIAAGGIYHMMMHPIYPGLFDAGSWVFTHLDYIKERKNLWYVGFGHLYLYRFTATVVNGNDPTLTYPLFIDEFSGIELDAEHWGTVFGGGSGAVTVSGGNVILDPEDNIINSAAIRSARSGITRIKARLKGTHATTPYIVMSLGRGDVVGMDSPDSWWEATFANGYAFRLMSNSRAQIVEMNNGVRTVQYQKLDLSLDYQNYHEYELILTASGVSVTQDGVEILSYVTTSPAQQGGYGMIAAGEYSNGVGDTAVVDWVKFLRDDVADVDPEPVVSGISEERAYSSENPVIQPSPSASQNYTSLSSFTETAIKNGGEIKYQLSNNSGNTWYWWDGAVWTPATAGYTESNTASEVHAHIQSFPTGEGLLTFRAYLHSDGTQQVFLSSVEIGYELASEPLPIHTGFHVAAPSCTAEKPLSSPDLFQINAKTDRVTLFFTPGIGPQDRYTVEYGYEPGQYLWAYEFEEDSTAVIAVDIGALQKDTEYYFRVRGGNGCQPGDWSNTLSVRTGQLIPTYSWNWLRTYSPYPFHTRPLAPVGSLPSQMTSSTPSPNGLEEHIQQKAPQDKVGEFTRETEPIQVQQESSLLGSIRGFFKSLFTKLSRMLRKASG